MRGKIFWSDQEKFSHQPKERWAVVGGVDLPRHLSHLVVSGVVVLAVQAIARPTSEWWTFENHNSVENSAI